MTMKGLIKTIGLLSSHAAAQRVEEMVRRGDLAPAGEAYADLKAECGRIVEVLAAVRERQG